MTQLKLNVSHRDPDRARALVLRYGWNATAYQIVNPGIEHWFAPGGNAVVGWVRAGLPLPGCRVRVVAGAPVCAPDDLAQVVALWEADARHAGETVCYLGAAQRLMELAGNRPGYSAVALGAQPVWEPAAWAKTVDGLRSVRAQLSRARNKGVTVTEWTAERAQSDPELARCRGSWLETRPLPPLGFLIEPHLSDFRDRRVWVASRAGLPVGFVTCSPIPARNGWLTEQFVRGAQAPNGTTELMLDAAIRALAAEGASYVTLGLVPLARAENLGETNGSDRNPHWLRTTLRLVRAHGRRFYNFDGLEQFKTKFQPHSWETIHAVVNDTRFRPRDLYAIADAFAGGSPFRALARGLGKAARQEARWFRQALLAHAQNGYTLLNGPPRDAAAPPSH